MPANQTAKRRRARGRRCACTRSVILSSSLRPSSDSATGIAERLRRSSRFITHTCPACARTSIAFRRPNARRVPRMSELDLLGAYTVQRYGRSMLQIDPLLMPVLGELSAGPVTDIAAFRAGELATARQIEGALTSRVPASVRVRDAVIPGEHPIPIRIYTPEGDRVRAGLLFAHGGGWASGSIEAADGHCGDLAAGADIVVVSVDYRLIPEHPFPAGLDDVSTALGWLAAHAEELGADAARLAIGGESAGANLAAAAAIQAREAGGPELRLQLLEVAALDLTDTMTESRREVLEQMPDFAHSIEAVRDAYAAAGADPRDPRVSPLLTPDLS